MDENKKALLKKAGITVLSLFFIFYVSYQVYLTSFDKVETYTALEKTANNSLFTKGFFIREEEYIINSASGTVIPIAQDGKKVSSGNAVAVEFDNDDAVSTYMRIQTLKSELERYIKLNSITPSSGGIIRSEIIEFTCVYCIDKVGNCTVNCIFHTFKCKTR